LEAQISGTLPHLRRQYPKHASLRRDPSEAAPLKHRGVIWQSRGSQAGENAKRKVERTNVHPCRPAQGSGRDSKVRDQPKGITGKARGEACDQRVDLWLRQAIKKEMCNDEVWSIDGSKGQSVLLKGPKAVTS